MSQTKAPVVQTENRLSTLLNTDSIRTRFEGMLGKRAPSFISSVISAVNSNPQLKDCEPMSVISSAAIAAAMDLPISPSLGFAYIVPYGKSAQFQVGWKGFIQLAMRSGQYKTINLAPVYEGQIKKHNAFTGEMEFESGVEVKGNPVGYLLYFKLLNGYEKYFYMTTEQCHKHGKRYSKSFAKNFGPWADDFNAMALKTVAKLGLSKYGMLSIDMQKALESDQAEVLEDGAVTEYPDATLPQIAPIEPRAEAPRLAALVSAAVSEAQVVEPVKDTPI